MKNRLLDCVTHQKKHCFQCNYEKTCDGQERSDCDTMKIKEYEQLVVSETKRLQTKMTAAIDKSMETIAEKQSELMAIIKFDPRKSAILVMNFELELKVISPGLFFII